MGGDLEEFYKIGSDQLDLIRYKNLGEEIRMPLITLVDASFREFHNYIVSGLENSVFSVVEEFKGIKTEVEQISVTTADPLIEEFDQLDNKSKEMLQIMNAYPLLEVVRPGQIFPLEALLTDSTTIVGESYYTGDTSSIFENYKNKRWVYSRQSQYLYYDHYIVSTVEGDKFLIITTKQNGLLTYYIVRSNVYSTSAFYNLNIEGYKSNLSIMTNLTLLTLGQSVYSLNNIDVYLFYQEYSGFGSATGYQCDYAFDTYDDMISFLQTNYDELLDENGNIVMSTNGKNVNLTTDSGDILTDEIPAIYKAELENYEDYLGIATEMEVP